MTTGGGRPPTKPPAGTAGAKPFLGDDDIVSELDAWDATFDALHETGSELGADPMAWPEPTTMKSPAIAISTVAPSPVVDDVPADVPVGQVSKRWIPASTSSDTFDEAVPNETDFSEVGVSGGPAALGELLGRATTSPPPFTELATDVEPSADATAIGVPALPDLEDDELDEEVLTSASRPDLGKPTSPPPNINSTIAIAVVPPVAAAPAAPAAPRKPAIIRRAVAGSAADAKSTPPGGATSIRDDGLPHPGGPGDETRVASLSAIEAQAVEARAARDRAAREVREARAKTPTAQPLPVLDEDYADIEIGADEPPSAAPTAAVAPAASAPVAAPGARRTAHVLRRADHATKPPPAGGVPHDAGGGASLSGPAVIPQRSSSPAVEIDADEPPLPPVRGAEPAEEDDFSDVAMALGADAELPARSGEIVSRPPSPTEGLDSPTFRPGARSGAIPITRAPSPAPAAPAYRPPSVEDVLATLDGDDDKTSASITRAPSVDDVLADLDTADSADSGDSADRTMVGIGAARPATPLPGTITVDDDEPIAELEASFDGPEPKTAISSPPPASATSARPPALVDLYPRVKTPTSVPPLGTAAGLASGASPAARTIMGLPPAAAPLPSRRVATSVPEYIAEDIADVEPALDLDNVQLPEQTAPLSASALDEDSAVMLAILEREVATVDEAAASAALRIEAGRLAERLGEGERARTHYDAALLADPRATPALRGLRRIARASGDLAEATRQLDAEIAIAGGLERRPLGHYRVDLLMAAGEQDLARVAVGEILDSAPSDVRALLAQLELAFLDGRADEFGTALEQLAHAVVDQELRAAVQAARAALAAHHNDGGAAATWFAAAAESDPAAIGARLGAIRNAAAQADGEAAGRALVDLAQAMAGSDVTTAAALAVRAQQWAPSSSQTAATASAVAVAIAPTDPIVARLATELAVATNDPAAAGAAFAHWATTPTSAAERGYAAARAAELTPGRGAELWAAASELDGDGGNDYAAAQLRTAYVAMVTDDATQDTKDAAMRKAIDVDLAICKADVERDRARLRAAFSLIGENQLDAAIELLAAGRAARPRSLAIAEALGEALANGQKWSDRARLFAELADDPGDQLDRDVAQLRSAIAWEEAVGAAAAAAGEGPTEHSVQKATANALSAWNRVLEAAGASPGAHASAIVLATRLGDRDVLGEVLARAQQAEKSPWAVSSLALRRARLFAADEPQRAESILRELGERGETADLDDPRRTAQLVMAAARRHEASDAALAIEERAARLPDGPESAALRLRAAQLALDAGDAAKATALLGHVERALPSLGVVPDLLAAARRRAGDRSFSTTSAPPPSHGAAPAAGDAFARLLRDADLAAAQNDGAAALALYQRALEMRPDDPLAVVPLVRVAGQLRAPEPLAALALSRLRAAETANDNAAKAEAYEMLARIDRDLRDDPTSAQMSLESASQADPSRLDLVHRLERHYAKEDRLAELIRLRRAAVANLPESAVEDRARLIADLAALAMRDQRTDSELAELYRAVLAAKPDHRLALHHLESIVRRQGPSAELAALEDKIAEYFSQPPVTDPRSAAAFYTRAGETLAETGNVPEAVLRFGKADAALPGNVFALEGWRAAALKGELWLDVADAATRQANATDDGVAKGALHHLAGVALMDKALDGDHAQKAFRRALDANRNLTDAFLRLRILLEEDGNHDDLATLLAQRLEVEPEGRAKIELHRALAELHRNFLSDRDTAKKHFRAILASDPNDLRAHAAVADIAWEQGSWEEAADALVARARLEREPDILKTLCYRLGLIYADRLVNVPMAIKAFQRALTYASDDENTLVRLADLATTAGEWKLALGACERLVKAEQDPERRAVHLQRVAKIFRDGFNDPKRAERALNLALDSAPTSDDALAALVQFYKDAGDMVSVRVHLNRVAGAMRARFDKDSKDGVACRVISRAMAARDQAGVPGSLAVARAAAELADMLGAAGDPERELLAAQPTPLAARLTKPEADEVLFPRGVPTELRQIFQLLGDRVAKHVGVDLRPYGATRGDRLRARDSEVAAAAQDVATQLGFGDIDVYLSARQPFAMVAEPTSPVSLILGKSLVGGSKHAVRFAAGAALKQAQASLAIPARLPVDDLGVLVVALLRLFQPEFPALSVDADAVTAQMQKLKRLIPTGLSNELRPFALAVDPQRFGHRELARDLRIAGLRAGLVASGSLAAGLGILAAQAEVADLAAVLADPTASGLVAFALSEDHATVAR
jgi:hypothetical protein|nr:hypothetical protein [Kofleriaceae bacterium]